MRVLFEFVVSLDHIIGAKILKIGIVVPEFEVVALSLIASDFVEYAHICGAIFRTEQL